MSWPIAETVGGDVAGRLRVTLRLDLADGSSVSMKTSTESEFVADPASFVSAFRFVAAPEPVGRPRRADPTRPAIPQAGRGSVGTAQLRLGAPLRA